MYHWHRRSLPSGAERRALIHQIRNERPVSEELAGDVGDARIQTVQLLPSTACTAGKKNDTDTKTCTTQRRQEVNSHGYNL